MFVMFFQLDGKDAGKFIQDEEPDFYEQAHGG